MPLQIISKIEKKNFYLKTLKFQKCFHINKLCIYKTRKFIYFLTKNESLDKKIISISSSRSVFYILMLEQ
jgi:hypothetical protein